MNTAIRMASGFETLKSCTNLGSHLVEDTQSETFSLFWKDSEGRNHGSRVREVFQASQSPNPWGSSPA